MTGSAVFAKLNTAPAYMHGAITMNWYRSGLDCRTQISGVVKA